MQTAVAAALALLGVAALVPAARKRARRASLLGMVAARVVSRRALHGPRLPQWSFGTEFAVELMRVLSMQSPELPPAPKARLQLERLTEPVPAGVTVRPLRVGGVPCEELCVQDATDAAPGAEQAGAEPQPTTASSAAATVEVAAEAMADTQPVRDLPPIPPDAAGPHSIPRDAKVLLYFHGGAYMIGSSRTHAALVARIVLAIQPLRVRAVLANYRLAPEHPFPAPVEDARAAYLALAERVGAENVFLGGDSAGGGLCLALMLSLQQDGLPLPKFAVLISPWVELEAWGDSYDRNADTDYVSRRLILQAAAVYCNGHDVRHPLISPLHADLAGLPPLLVQTGSAEVFADANSEFVRRARAAGVDVEFEEWASMPHVFQTLARMQSEAVAAVRDIGRFVRQQYGVDRPVSAL